LYYWGRKQWGKIAGKTALERQGTSVDLLIEHMIPDICTRNTRRNRYFLRKIPEGGAVFSHPDYTVGPGMTPGQPLFARTTARGLYRRSGIGNIETFPHPAPKTLLYYVLLKQ
jgi:hypothetical protein